MVIKSTDLIQISPILHILICGMSVNYIPLSGYITFCLSICQSSYIILSHMQVPQSRYGRVPLTLGSWCGSCFYNHANLSPASTLPSLAPVPNPWQPLICSPISRTLSFQKCCIKGIIQYITFGDWLFCTQRDSSKFLSVSMVRSFSLLSSVPWYTQMYHSLCNHSPIEGQASGLSPVWGCYE